MDRVLSAVPVHEAATANPMEDSVSSFVIDDLEGIICGSGENEASVPLQISPPSNELLQPAHCMAHKSLPVVPTYTYNNSDVQQQPLDKPILTLPARGPVLRSKSFDDALFPRRTNELLRDPPNTIVFITSMQRQRRRSSICSQITLDEDIDHSSYNGYNGMEVDEVEDNTNTSLDVHDVFEPKVEYKFHQRRENQSSSSRSSMGDSSNSTTRPSSYCHDSTMKRKRPTENVQRAASFRLPLRKQTSVRTTNVNQCGHQSAKLNNSAKLRWLQDEDSDSSEASSSSEYEDFAQDSLKRGTSGRKQNMVATLAEWKLVAEDEEMIITNRVPLQRHPEAPPRRNSTGVGRVA